MVKLEGKELNPTNAGEVKYTLTGTAKDKLEVEFNDLLTNIDPAKDFEIKVAGDEYTKEFSYDLIEDNYKTIIKFTITGSVGKATDNTNFDKGAINILSTEIKNSFDVDAQFSQDDKVDKIAPEIKDVTVAAKGSVTGDVYSRDVTITFTEDMDARTFSYLSFEIENGTVKSAEKVGDNGLKLVVEHADDMDIVFEDDSKSYVNIIPTSTEGLKVKDLEGNILNLKAGDVKKQEVTVQ